MNDIGSIMRLSPVIPVLVIDDAGEAREIAEALVDGGLKVLEVTMRTPAALDAIREMSKVEGAVVGAGTVLNAQHLEQALDAGSQFIVSPGLTDSLGRAAVEAGANFLPGVSNAGDIMRGLDLGLTHFKFFPAETSGGILALKALAGPFGNVRFCPTGGITLQNAPQWLALDPILCVGGTWLVQRGAAVDRSAITAAAREASALRA